MMSMEAFEQHCDPLKKKWEQHFTADVRVQIYHIVKNSPEDGFKRLVLKLIWNKPFNPPPIEDFITFSREYSKKYEPIKGEFCDLCGYLGTVTGEDGSGMTSVWRCSCENANELPTHIKDEFKRPLYWKKWDEVKDHFQLIKPINRNLKCFNEDEKKDNWKLLWDVFNKKINKDEAEARIQILQRTIEIATENSRRFI